MIYDLNYLFSRESAKRLYDNFCRARKDFAMDDLIRGGVLLGLSGGADSVALLLLLCKLREEYCFSLHAVHVNHMIRGAEADRDEEFSRSICKALNVDFSSFSIDIPRLSAQRKCGLEETARYERYRIFDSVLKDKKLSVIAVAHNATDNLETIIFNMMRGAGLSGLCGISPVRDNIIRPLIYSPKDLVISSLSENGISYVEDCTNSSSDYSRNFIRHEIIPRLKKLNANPEEMGTRVSGNLREDKEYLGSVADNFINNNLCDGRVPLSELSLLPKSVFFRVINSMISLIKSGCTLEKTHVDKIFSLLSKDRFSYDIPGGLSCKSDGVYLSIVEKEKPPEYFDHPLTVGLNTIEGFNDVILISSEKSIESYLNIYKISIQAQINFDIISKGISVRNKREGDSYRYANMTRKLKKLFCDRKIPLSERANVPVFYSREGILWVPGFKVRESLCEDKTWFLSILTPIEKEQGKRCFFIPK